MKEILSKVKKDTGKFWSFKDTTKHTHLKHIYNKRVTRIFTLKKSLLIKVDIEKDNNFEYVIPLSFTSNNWPSGSYCALSGNKKVFFGDNCIVSVI
tara:strand:- start:45 stop:332 length:288 start_codon:yes stop_codon:yes gene_type:complete